jgi:hypothetical protein
MDLDMMPMPASGGIEAFREKLHARMASLGRLGGGAELRDRDELLKEHRRQHATMREPQLEEIKEKIQRAEVAGGGKKGKVGGRTKIMHI